MALFDVGHKSTMDGDTRYSRALKIPQYEPKNKKPLIQSLYNYEKYAKLLKAINNSNVSEEEKQFLRLAASRHIVFNYSLIADYYSHSNAEMQKLMEDSALVIIDIDDAIADGYLLLSEKLKDLITESRRARGDDV